MVAYENDIMKTDRKIKARITKTDKGNETVNRLISGGTITPRDVTLPSGINSWLTWWYFFCGHPKLFTMTKGFEFGNDSVIIRFFICRNDLNEFSSISQINLEVSFRKEVNFGHTSWTRQEGRPLMILVFLDSHFETGMTLCV